MKHVVISLVAVSIFVLSAAQTHAQEDRDLRWPTSSKRISQHYSSWHRSVDIAGKTGDPIYAVHSGKIEKTLKGFNGGYGNLIYLRLDNGYFVTYGSLEDITVKSNQQVRKGQKIATLGSSGRSTGSHLHLEVSKDGERINPGPLYFK